VYAAAWLAALGITVPFQVLDAISMRVLRRKWLKKLMDIA
jgi:hypothetical protein